MGSVRPRRVVPVRGRGFLVVWVAQPRVPVMRMEPEVWGAVRVVTGSHSGQQVCSVPIPFPGFRNILVIFVWFFCITMGILVGSG